MTTNPTPATASGSKDPLVGARIANCVLQQRIGAGGMGAVYLAHHIGLNKRVAVKILSKQLIGSEANIQRFIREAQLAASLEHTNIVQVFDVGESSGLYYLAMQYVEGRSLDKIIQRGGRLPLGDAVDVVKQVAAGLSAAHKLNIIHRDIKPANILLSREGVVKVVDFGLARSIDSGVSLSAAGTIVGTPHYMAPEQAQGKPTDGRTDIYALGATFYHIVTGQPVFDGPTPIAIVLKQVNEEPSPAHFVNKDLPPSVSELISKMMAKDPEARFQTMQDVGIALDIVKAAPTGLLSTLGDAPAPIDPLSDLGGETMLNLGAPSPDQVVAGAPTVKLADRPAAEPDLAQMPGDPALTMLGLGSGGEFGSAPTPATHSAPAPLAAASPPPVVPPPPNPTPLTPGAMENPSSRIRLGTSSIDSITSTRTRFDVGTITKVRQRSTRVRTTGEAPPPSTHEATFSDVTLKMKFVNAEQMEKCKLDLYALRLKGDTVQLGHILLQRHLVTLAQYIAVQTEVRRREAEDQIEQPAAGEAVMFQHYRLIRTLAIEENAVVWEAEDTKRQRHVALRFLKSSEAKLAKQLYRVAAQGRELDHPSIMAVYDAGSELDHSGRLVHFMALEQVEGCSLADAVQGHVYSIPRLITLFEKITEAVQLAHAKKFVHGDLKPTDIIIDAQDRPIVAFFGLHAGGDAQSTSQENPTRMPYQAPEQFDGRNVLDEQAEPRTDVWHIGVMLYEALSGRSPFLGASVGDTKRRILEKEPESIKKFNPEVGSTLDAVVRKAIEKDLASRYVTASELLAGLRAAENPDSRTGPLKPELRRSRWAAFLAWTSEPVNIQRVLVGIVLLVGMSGTWWFLFGTSPKERMFAKKMADAKRAYFEGDFQRALEESEEALKYGTDIEIRKVAVDSKKHVTTRSINAAISEMDAAARVKDADVTDTVKRLEKRLKDLEKVTLEPEYVRDADTASLLGTGCRIVNQLDRAEASLLNALQLGSTDGEVYLSLAWVNITRWMIAEQAAEPLTGEGEIRSRSAEWVRNAMKYAHMKPTPERAGIRAARGEAMIALCQADWARVHEICSDALTRWPTEPDSEEFLILLGWTSGDPDDRLRCYSTAISLRRTNALPYILRGGLRMEKSAKEAIKDFDAALKLAPDTYLINLVRGRAWQKKGDFARARSDYDVALAADPRLVDALAGRAMVRHAQADVAGGDNDFAEAIRIRPEYRWTYIYRANVRRFAHDFAGAESDYRAAIALAPLDGNIYVMLGDSRVDAKDFDGAIRAYTDALRNDSDCFLAFSHRGAVLEQVGRFREAAGDYENALTIAPEAWDRRIQVTERLEAVKKKF